MMDFNLEESLKTLKLSGMLSTYGHRLSQAHENGLTHEEWLSMLVQDELEERQGQALLRRLSRAKFEADRTFERFDLKRYPSKLQTLLRHLKKKPADGYNVLIVGPTGTGKSHLAQALGHEACRQGRTVRFVRVSVFLRELHASRADHGWDTVLKRYTQPSVLILDDFGLSTFNGVQGEDLYELIAERHGKGSWIITSNRKVESWVELFPDPAIGSAAVDRLVDKSQILVLEGESYRQPLSLETSSNEKDAAEKKETQTSKQNE